MVLALAAGGIAQPVAAAKAIEEKNVVAGKAKLDPAMGYIFASPGGRMFATFLRIPEGAERTAWQGDWDKAFAKATEKYRRELKSWEVEVKSARELKTKPPARPVEPTAANFAIDALETRDMANFGPMYVYSKANDTISYLTEVKPGAITDIGNFLNVVPTDPPYDFATFEIHRKAQEKAARTGGTTAPATPPPAAFGELPASLKGWPTVSADFRASGKVNNYYLLPLTRIPPIPGIIAYRRDTVIDVKTGTEVPNPPIRTVLKIKR